MQVMLLYQTLFKMAKSHVGVRLASNFDGDTGGRMETGRLTPVSLSLLFVLKCLQGRARLIQAGERNVFWVQNHFWVAHTVIRDNISVSAKLESKFKL